MVCSLFSKGISKGVSVRMTTLSYRGAVWGII